MKKILISLFAPFLFLSQEAFSQEQTFDLWLEELKQEAIIKGITKKTLAATLSDLSPQPKVLELDRWQPEFSQTFTRYLKKRVTEERIARGKELLSKHQILLKKMQGKYSVQPEYLVSFWGLESNYGDYTGGFSTIRALATLAYDTRRSVFFRKELFAALRIIDSGHVKADQMSSSWAGALGQLQFMPSTFENYGIDGNGDGKIDLWNTLEDVFASAANYLSKFGWKDNQRWGREIQLPDNFNYSLAQSSISYSMSEWKKLGITLANGQKLPQITMTGSIVLPAGASGPAFLTHKNFRTTMVWNRSSYYAIAVGHLADRFVGGETIQNMPINEKALSRDEIKELQQKLNKYGFDSGTVDAILGPKTKHAIRAFQQKNKLPADGYASHEILTLLRKQLKERY
ncbi:lytic murein transglycosylase [Pseudomonadota bacterium]